jgi:hypothetical protein
MIEMQYGTNFLIRNISRNILYFIVDNADRTLSYGMDKSKCGYLIRITYMLSCVCTIVMKIKLNTPIRLYEIHIRRKMLWFEVDNVANKCLPYTSHVP